MSTTFDSWTSKERKKATYLHWCLIMMIIMIQDNDDNDDNNNNDDNDNNDERQWIWQ